MTAESPDCTGQRFGMLLVLGKGSRQPRPACKRRKNSTRQLWRVLCDCGREVEILRGSFETKGQISCGCKRSRGLVDNKRRPKDIRGQRFEQLVAIKLTGNKDKYNKPTWLLQCDCGAKCESSLTDIQRKIYMNTRVSCGDRVRHPEKCLWYPPTPSPYPREAGELLVKYLPLTYLHYQQVDSAVEDQKRDRLLRAAWIIVYRRSQGEEISELYESRIIKKHLRYCSIQVYWRRVLEKQGGLIFDVSSKKRQIKIGDTVTINSVNYPSLETPETNILSENNTNNINTAKRLKFRRC